MSSSTKPKTTVDYGSQEQAMQSYLVDGEQRARSLNNRGPLRFEDDGRVHQEILDSYWQHGFYILENVMRPEELDDIKADLAELYDRFPVHKGATVDRKGRPAAGADCKATTLFWSKPLSDPFGGTDQANGRHPVKMTEPTPADDAPDDVVYLILGPLQFSDAMVRAYGNPQLLKVAAAINGDDFVPFNEALFIKEPGRGVSVAWHQDGATHWNNPDWDEGSHGFNFMGQVYGCTAANGVWVVPGSHKVGKIDIASMISAIDTERLPDAVPILCNPGDVAISNRQILHGSFANTSKDWRVTVNMGFHRRSSVLDVVGGGLHNPTATYDDERIRQRARIIGYGIDARKQRYPDETPFDYQPHRHSGDHYQWNEAAKASLHDYNLLDLSI